MGLPSGASAARFCTSTTKDGTLNTGPSISCSFARTVERKANAAGIPRKITARSSVTRRTYTLYRVASDDNGYRYQSRTDDGLWIEELYN